MDNNTKLDDLMIRGREKRRSQIYKSFVGLIERMVGVREFHRVGPEYLKALEFREVLLELWEISRGAIYNIYIYIYIYINIYSYKMVYIIT